MAPSYNTEGVDLEGEPVVSAPVLIGGRANENEPTRVDDGDVAHTWHDLEGRQIVILNVPSRLAATGVHGPHYQNVTGSGDTALIVAPGAGQSIYVTYVYVSSEDKDADDNRVGLREGGGGTFRWRTLIDSNNSGQAVGQIPFNPPWKLPANTALVANMSNGNDTDWTIQFFVAA